MLLLSLLLLLPLLLEEFVAVPEAPVAPVPPLKGIETDDGEGYPRRVSSRVVGMVMEAFFCGDVLIAWVVMRN